MAALLNCVQFPIPRLPSLGAGITLPSFSFQFNGDFSLCCHIKLFNVPPVNVGGIPIGGAVFKVINSAIATVDAYLDALDGLQLTCPFD